MSTGVRVAIGSRSGATGWSAGTTSSPNNGTGVSIGLPSAALASSGRSLPFGRTSSSTV